jgi:hypothetical protein
MHRLSQVLENIAVVLGIVLLVFLATSLDEYFNADVRQTSVQEASLAPAESVFAIPFTTTIDTSDLALPAGLGAHRSPAPKRY